MSRPNGPGRLWDRVVRHVRAAMQRERISSDMLAERLGWHPRRVNRLLRLDTAPHVDDLDAIARACGVPLATLLTRNP